VTGILVSVRSKSRPLVVRHLLVAPDYDAADAAFRCSRFANHPDSSVELTPVEFDPEAQGDLKGPQFLAHLYGTHREVKGAVLADAAIRMMGASLKPIERRTI
jgi:hypothetical protein